MCKAFSAVVRNDGAVFWKAGLDSHEEIKKHFKLEDKFLDAEHCGETPALCPVEVVPKEGYLYPEKGWTFQFDEPNRVPSWWKPAYEKKCMAAQKKWQKEVYSNINLKEARNPVHPFKIPPPEKITEKHISLLVEWDSVRDSVWDSVRDSVGDSVRDSVWDSVGDSVWGSVWDSVWGYIGSLFRLPRIEWKYTEKIKTKGYPFESIVKLWKMGLVPSFDGKIWRLHGGKDAKILFEISAEELRKKEGLGW